MMEGDAGGGSIRLSYLGRIFRSQNDAEVDCVGELLLQLFLEIA
jgi:hypothetical protein